LIIIGDLSCLFVFLCSRKLCLDRSTAINRQPRIVNAYLFDFRS
jgi:hypothetical protein